MDNQQTIDCAISIMEQWARDDSHGYDQGQRWGERGDYDCSSAVISAWEQAGVPVKHEGATFTGNMRAAFLRCGFREVTGMINLANGAGLQRGDVLLNIRNHTAMYCGDGMEVEASINEYGGTTGGQPGDQTGREFLIRTYRNYPWDCVLRYEGEGGDPQEIPAAAATKNNTRHGTCQIIVPVLAQGDTGPAVAAAQAALHHMHHALGSAGIDGDFGPATEAAVKNYQQTNGLDADGEIGAATWSKIMN